MTSAPTGTVTFLFTDIEGSTRLWDARHEEMAEAVEIHDRLIRHAVATHGGHIFSTAGDSFTAAFRRPADGLAAAIDAQVALGRQQGPGDLRLRVRMTLHSGVAAERDGDYFGPALNRGARLLALASGGQVLLTEAIHGMVKDQPPPGVSFSDQGTHRLRDLSAAERIFAVVHPELEAPNELHRSLDSHPNNLPLQGTTFVGRDQELEEALKYLAGSRLLTITGVGGSGKTRLALQVATSVFDRYRDGIWLVELAAVAEPVGVMRAIAAALGVREEAGEPLEKLVADHLRTRQLLLILDNCEHLLDTASGVTQRLLSTAHELTVLATSREMLGIAGETPYQLRSMSLPAADERPEVVARYDAVRLFSARAESVRAGFRVNADNASAVVALCQRLDGMPLAIELAAARLRVLSPEQIAARLDDRFRLLTGGSRTALPRQQTLQAAIDWSYDLLDPGEKSLFNRLSVFQGGFSLEAAEAVCGSDPLDPAMVLDLLTHLVDKSLVTVVAYEAEARYRLLETLRQYGRDRLAESGEAEATRAAHATHFRKLAETALPRIRGPEEQIWLGRLETDHDNLRQALRWAIDADQSGIAQGLAGTLYRFWMIRHHSEEGRTWLEQAIAMEPGDTDSWGRAQLGAGTMALLHGDLEPARHRLEAAMVGLREGDNQDLTLAAMHNLAMAVINLGDYDLGKKLAGEELSAAKERGDFSSMAFASQELASLANASDDFEEGRTRIDEAVKYAEETKSVEMLGNVLTTAIFEALLVDDLDQAEEYSQRLGKMGQVPSAPGRHLILEAVVVGRRGDPQRAISAIKKIWATEFRSLADYRSIAGVMTGMFMEVAGFELATGSPERAATFLGGSEQLLRGATRLPHEQRLFDRLRTSVLESLAAEKYEACFQRGLRLGFDELLDFAVD